MSPIPRRVLWLTDKTTSGLCLNSKPHKEIDSRISVCFSSQNVRGIRCWTFIASSNCLRGWGRCRTASDEAQGQNLKMLTFVCFACLNLRDMNPFLERYYGNPPFIDWPRISAGWAYISCSSSRFLKLPAQLKEATECFRMSLRETLIEFGEYSGSHVTAVKWEVVAVSKWAVINPLFKDSGSELFL